MSNDITEVGGFEPKRYMGHLLTVQYMHKPSLDNCSFAGKIGVYDKYPTETPFYAYLIDEENGHYYLAKEELDNDAEI